MFRVAAPISTFDENPCDSFVTLANAPWVDINKMTDRVPNNFKDLFRPHLQGEIWEFYPDKIVRGSVIERVETNEPAMQCKETSLMYPRSTKDGIRIGGINKVETEPVFHKV